MLETEFDSSMPLIDQVKQGKDIKEAVELLNSVGLTEAHLYVKTPYKISNGQKYRFAVAKLCDSGKPIWVADEFASTLNPEMAAIVAKGLRKLAFRYGATVILAAPHVDYFVDSLLPNKIVKLRWGMQASLYSIKISSFQLKNKDAILNITSNGDLTLKGVETGFIEQNGMFRLESHTEKLAPKQTVLVKVKLKVELPDGDFYGVVVKSREGVGDVVYWG
ncbi:MAG: hypothetical protein RMJ39_08960 [Deltaproteobacteria bacterium]|nr:hypothetical protein [Deltaproteobacteria bacterium]